MLRAHLTRWASLLWKLRPRRASQRQLREIAAALDARARLLLSPKDAPAASGPSLREILLSTTELLDGAIAARGAAPDAAAPGESGAADEPSLGTALAGGPHPPAEGPHPVSWDLIGMRDWIAVARDEANESAREALSAVDRKIVRILAQQGITALDAHGALDPAVHQVVEWRPTAESARHNEIAATIRAGYVNDATVLRPQEVIVFTSAPAPE
jgi:hypothetical protein